MNIVLAAIGAGAIAAPSPAQNSGEIAELRTLIEEIRTDYEQRLSELERRLQEAEQAATARADLSPRATVARTTAPPQGGSVTVGNAFNPQLSVILDGAYYHDDADGTGQSLTAEAFQPSHSGHGHEEDAHVHGADISNGFNMREMELAFNATVDPYFDAVAYLAVEPGGDVEIEEAWFATRMLPAGLRLKGGKFLSDIGYLNNRHPHQWDFMDQGLAYEGLLGDHGLQDTGLQLTWLPEVPFYALVGAEILQGEQERLGAFIENDDEREELGLRSKKDGPRLFSLFAKVAPDLGYDHALQIGASFVHNQQHQEIHDEPLFETGLEGDAGLWGIDVVYKYDNPALFGHRDFNFQAEYLKSTKDLVVSAGDPAEIGSDRKFTTDGLYIQGTYGFAPRWQFGLRYDALGLTNRIRGDVRESFGSSNRWTGVLTWTPTEFSRLRLQFTQNDFLTDDGEHEKFDSVWLQWLMSLGSHGAHRF